MAPNEDGTLSVGDRLKRIEDALVAVLGKFEVVAAHADLEALRARMEGLERDGSPLATRTATKLDTLEVRVDLLEEKVATSEATQRALAAQRKWYITTLVSLLAASGAIQFVLAYLHH